MPDVYSGSGIRLTYSSEGYGLGIVDAPTSVITTVILDTFTSMNVTKVIEWAVFTQVVNPPQDGVKKAEAVARLIANYKMSQL